MVLAAHSMGFLEALHWARKYPEEVSVLVGLDPAVPQVYQHMELDAVHRRLEDLHRSSWKRRLLFRLTSRALLKRFPASERRELAPAARRNFVSVVWVNEARDLPRSIRQVQQEGPARLCPRAVPGFQRQGHPSSPGGMADVRKNVSLRFFRLLSPSVRPSPRSVPLPPTRARGYDPPLSVGPPVTLYTHPIS